MKILFILPEYYPHSGGGISTYYINYIKALRPSCDRIKVIVGSGYYTDNSKFEIDGVEVEALNPELYRSTLSKFTRFDLEPELRNNMAAAWAMYEQANKGEEFDIIECTDFALGFIPWVINHSKPVITRLHGSTGQIASHENGAGAHALSTAFIKQIELLLLPLCNGLITHSTANKTFWNNLLNTNCVIKIDPVFNGTVQQPLPLRERDNYGLVTARIQKWKGPVELCKAVSELKETSRPLIKWFGRDMIYTTSQTTGQYLADNFPSVWGKSVIAKAPVDNASINQLQLKAKFGVVPSTWDMYNFTCLEFLACGTPVICSDGAGVADIIDHGINGFKYPANDATALSDCLKQFDQISEEEYEKMCASAIQSVNLLNAARIIPQNIEQYTTVLSNFKPQPANVYLTNIYAPADVKRSIDDVLDKQALKNLSRYLFKRVVKKFTGKK